MKADRSFILILLLTFYSGALITVLSPMAIDIEQAIPQITQSDVNFVVSVFLIVGASSSLIWAILIERFSAKKILVVTTLEWAIFEFFTMFSTNLYSLLFFQFFAAIGFGAIVPFSYSLITELFEPEKRGKAFGLKETVFVVGYGASYILSGFLVGIFPWFMPLIIISMGGFSLAFLLAFSKEPASSKSNSNSKNLEIDAKKWLNVRDLRQIAVNKSNILILMFYFLTWIGNGAIAQCFTTFLRNDYGLSPEIATVFLIIVFCGQIPSGIIFGNLADKWYKKDKNGRIKILFLCLVCGTILNSVAFTLVFSMSNLGLIVFFVVFTCGGSTFLNSLDPLTQTAIGDINPSRLRSTSFAICDCCKIYGRSLSILLIVNFFNYFNSQYRPGYIILSILTLIFSTLLIPLMKSYPNNVIS